MDDLSHVDESGAVRMVDVGGKEPMRRRAVARAEVRMAAETARKLRELPKGDALAAAVAAVETTAQTGVEMEALTAASVAALTVYDMAKAIDKQMRIAEVVLVKKTKEPVA